jgi:hypothetical protein
MIKIHISFCSLYTLYDNKDSEYSFLLRVNSFMLFREGFHAKSLVFWRDFWLWIIFSFVLLNRSMGAKSDTLWWALRCRLCHVWADCQRGTVAKWEKKFKNFYKKERKKCYTCAGFVRQEMSKEMINQRWYLLSPFFLEPGLLFKLIMPGNHPWKNIIVQCT